MTELIATALAAAEHGYFVFPIVVRDDEKVPIIAWKTGASRDPDKIAAMPWGDANLIGIACEPSGIVVVDLDVRGEFEESFPADLFAEWQDLVASHWSEDDAPPAEHDPPWVESWHGGVHVYLRADPELEMGCGSGDVAPNIDIRGIGGIIVCYADNLPSVEDLPPVPSWLWELNRKASDHLTPKSPPADEKFAPGEAGTRYGLAGLQNEVDAIRASWDAADGGFNHALNRSSYSIGQLVGGGELELGDAYQCLLDCLRELGAPADQYKTLDSGFHSGFDRPRSAKQAVLAEREVESEEVEAMRARLLDSDGMDRLPPLEWLIPGWLELDSLCMLVGPPGSGKSFIALDIAARLSSGMPWPKDGSRPSRTKALYLSAEGVRGMRVRKQGWEAAHGLRVDMSFYPDPIQINSHDWDVFIDLVREDAVRLVVVDTQAACTVGVDENAFETMSRVIERVERLRRLSGACVMLVHHTAKSGGAGSRGSSVMLGAISTEISVSQTHGKIKLRNTKQKNAEKAPDAIFDLKKVPGGEDWVVPRFVAEATIGDTEKIGASVYRQTASKALKVATAPLSVAELLAQCGLKDRRTLARCLKELVEGGLITEQSGLRGGQKAALYSWKTD